MKRGRGINGRDDRSSGIEIRMADAFLAQTFFFFFSLLNAHKALEALEDKFTAGIRV
jgi:hypothetical protein